MIDHSYTIDELCKAERISRAMLYKLWSRGEGPRFYYVGSVRRISHQARTAWHRKLETAGVEARARIIAGIPASDDAA
jgi:hypothetical protein